MKTRRLFAVMAISGLINGLTPVLGSASEGTQVASYIVRLKEQADVSQVSKISDLDQRRWNLYATLRGTADRTQAPLRDLLQREQELGRVESVTALWIDNAIAFRGQTAVASAIAKRSEVERVSVDEIVTVKQTAGADTALWNLLKVRASGAGGVWDQGFSGAGITVGSIDTGVDFNHPALEPHFRGAPAAGEERFHYNWFDFFGITRYPIDLNGHGTHVMGTIVGGDGPGPFTPDIGLAYNAKWIAARAFDQDGNGTTLSVLLASQFMQAPTDLNGLNPRPDLAPDVINNSWGAGNGDGLCRPHFQLMIRNWRLANMMPVFSIGDTTAHSPGDMGKAAVSLLEQSSSYSTGASDINDSRSNFSPEVTTGAACPLQTAGQIRPNILAPGVNIYSSVPQGAGTTNAPIYTAKSGTSMAAAHVSGAAALMLEAAGGRGSITTNDYHLDGEIDASAAQLATGSGCVDTCGRLDALAAVQAVRKDGILQGRVTFLDGAIERPLANAKISAIPAAGLARVTYTDATGAFMLRKLNGTYSVESRGPVTVSVTNEVIGWIRQKITGVTITSTDTVTRNFLMQRAPNRVLQGDVLRYASGDPVVGTVVKLEETPLTATTDGSGHFQFPAVPDPSAPDPGPGDLTTDYELLTGGDRCSDPKRQSIVIKDPPASNAFQIVRALRRDGFGYYCVEKGLDFVPGTSKLQLNADDGAAELALPFTFPFYGIARNKAYVSTNGFIRFDVKSSEFGNTGIPNAVSPNAAAYAFWDDLAMDSRSSILTTTTPDSFVIEWRKMTFAPGFFDRVTFSTTLHRNGDIEFQYTPVDNTGRAHGSSATIGLENHKGDTAFQYSNAEAVVFTGKSILFSAALQAGVVRGVVRGTGGEAVPFAKVTATDSSGVPRTVNADAAGSWSHNLQADGYSIKASAFHYDAETLTGISITTGNMPNCFPASACPVNFSLVRQPGYTVTGVVTDTVTSGRIHGTQVSLNHPNIPAVRTDGIGVYTFTDIPAGTYFLSIGGTGLCVMSATRTITVSGNSVENMGTTIHRDSFGYACRDDDAIDNSHELGTVSPMVLTGDDEWVETAIPFVFSLYGHLTTRAFISSNGFVRFDTGSAQYDNVAIPFPAAPNFVLMPFWDDLVMDAGSRVQTHTDGTGYFSIEWIDMVPNSDPETRLTFEAILHPTGNFEYQYRVIDADKAAAFTATVGFEDRNGQLGFDYAAGKPGDQALLASGRRVEFLIDHSEVVYGLNGFVSQEGTTNKIAGAVVSSCGGCPTGTTTTDSGGAYTMPLPSGTYSITASKSGFVSQTKSVTVGSSFVRLDFQLAVDPVPLPTSGINGSVFQDGTTTKIAGAQVSRCGGCVSPTGTVTTNSEGVYTLPLPSGTYSITASKSGFISQTKSVTVGSSFVNLDFELAVDPGAILPTSGITGSVFQIGTINGIAGAQVSRCGGCVSPTGTATTDSEGGYTLPLPPGDYSITASKSGFVSQTKPVTVGSSFVNLDFELAVNPGGDGGLPSSGINGFVFRDGTSNKLAGVTITRCSGCVSPTGTVTTNSEGTYTLPLPAGTYSITASKFGSLPQTKSVTVASSFVRLDFQLPVAPLYKLSGVVTDQFGKSVPGIGITIRELSAVRPGGIFADGDGAYSVTLPQASYELNLPGRCVQSTVPASPQQLLLNAPMVRNFTANLLADTYGYTCVNRGGSFVPGTVPIFLPGPGTTLFPGAGTLGPIYAPRVNGIGDDTSIPIVLPFDIPIYGKARKVAFVNVDGFVQFDNGAQGIGGPILNVLNNPAFIVDGAEIFVGTSGVDAFVIEWRAVRLGDSPIRVTFELILHTSGHINYIYRAGTDSAVAGAKIGISDECPVPGGSMLNYADKIANSVKAGQEVFLRPPDVAGVGYTPC